MLFKGFLMVFKANLMIFRSVWMVPYGVLSWAWLMGPTRYLVLFFQWKSQ